MSHLIKALIIGIHMLPRPDDLLRNVLAVVPVAVPYSSSAETNNWLWRTVSHAARQGNSKEDWKRLFA